MDTSEQALRQAACQIRHQPLYSISTAQALNSQSYPERSCATFHTLRQEVHLQLIDMPSRLTDKMWAEHVFEVPRFEMCHFVRKG